VVRLGEWKLLFTINRDGYSYHNFFEKLEGQAETVLLIEDGNGHKFGAFATHAWEWRKGFQGDGSSFVFSFHKGDDLHVWTATGCNEMFQHTDKDGIIIGGSLDNRYHAALTVFNNF
jgi:hypothetical protein